MKETWITFTRIVVVARWSVSLSAKTEEWFKYPQDVLPYTAADWIEWNTI